MKSTSVIPQTEFSEVPVCEDIILLIDQHIKNLKLNYSQLNPPISEYLDNFLENIEFLLTSITTAGASYQTILKDLECVSNILSNITTDNIVNLRERVITHQGATSLRNRLGVTSSIGGFGVCIGAGITFFSTAVVSVPVILGSAAIGGIMIATGTGTVVDAKRKRKPLAECEQDIINFIMTSLIESKNYAGYACAQLSIIKFDAQNRGENQTRDMILDRAIEVIYVTTDLLELMNLLSELEVNLIGNSSRSTTATDVNKLLNNFKDIKVDMNISSIKTGLSCSK